jgi:hypothetical protein
VFRRSTTGTTFIFPNMEFLLSNAKYKQKIWVTHTEGPNEASDPVTGGPKMTFRFAEGLC